MLKNVRESGDQYTACCPAHDDHDASLSFRQSADGTLLITCHAGCSFDDIIDAAQVRVDRTKSSQPKNAPSSPPVARKISSENAMSKWARMADTQFKSISDEQRKELANKLGLHESALEKLHVGWSSRNNSFTFPELDGHGDCIGIQIRRGDGTKTMRKGSARGLYFAPDVLKRSDPIVIPEGASDVAAAISAGLCAVGRPSATGGLEHLAGLLAAVPPDRSIVVLGEMDAKTDGGWPGKEAAEKMAADLATKLGRPIGWMLPPEGKDLREFIRKRPQGKKFRERGAELLSAIEAKAKWIEPVADEFEIKIESASDLLKREIPLEWLVDELFVRDQPIVVGAAKKSLKTTICLDLAISLSGGVPFLGFAPFSVPRKQRVLMISGDAVIKQTIKRQASAKGGKTGMLTKELIENLTSAFKLPKLSDDRSLAALERHLANQDVLIVDPLYLCLLAGNRDAQASNLFDVGPLLSRVAELCAKHGVTLILVHHFPKKKSASKDLPDLDDLAFAGTAEFARQWLLLARRDEFVHGSGLHNLWMVSGNSAGASGAWGLDIDEGRFDPTGFESRRWHVSVKPFTDVKVEAKKKSEETAAALVAKDTANVLEYLSVHPSGDTQSGIATATTVSRPRVKAAIEKLLSDRKIEAAKVPKAGGAGGKTKLYDGFRAVKTTDAGSVAPMTKAAKPKLLKRAGVHRARSAEAPSAGTAG